jgi:response regulator RpfG family c-di-GMP phosphodiesterase
MAALRAESGKHFDPHLVQVFDQQAATVYRTLTEADEEQLQAHKHFSLDFFFMASPAARRARSA